MAKRKPTKSVRKTQRNMKTAARSQKRKAAVSGLKLKKHSRVIRKTPRKISSTRKQHNVRSALMLICIGLVMLGASVTHRILRYRSLVVAQEVVAEHTQVVNNRKPVPTHISIKWFVDSDIEERTFVNNEWSISEDKATYLLDSARPGEAGNIIVYGHNTRQILGNIRALKGGELVTITTADGAIHKYRVESLHEVSPKDISYVQPKNEEVLTMYTCSGLFDSQRFIAVAKPIVEEK